MVLSVNLGRRGSTGSGPFAGESSRPRASKLNIEYFFNRFFSGGWAVGMAPTISINWTAAAGQKLTLPIGLGAGHAFVMSDKTAVHVGFQALYMVVHPDSFGQRAQFEVTGAPVLEKPWQGVR